MSIEDENEQYKKRIYNYWAQVETIRVLREKCANGDDVYDYVRERLEAEQHDLATIYRLLYEVALHVDQASDAHKTAVMLVRDHKASPTATYELGVTAWHLFRCKANRAVLNYFEQTHGGKDLGKEVSLCEHERKVALYGLGYDVYIQHHYDIKDYCDKTAELVRYVPNLEKLKKQEEKLELLASALLRASKAMIDRWDPDPIEFPRYCFLKEEEPEFACEVGRHTAVEYARRLANMVGRDFSDAEPLYRSMPNASNYRFALQGKRPIFFCKEVREAVYNVGFRISKHGELEYELLFVSTDACGCHVVLDHALTARNLTPFIRKLTRILCRYRNEFLQYKLRLQS